MCTLKNVNSTGTTNYCIVSTINDQSLKASKKAEDITELFNYHFPVAQNPQQATLSYRDFAKNYIKDIEKVAFF